MISFKDSVLVRYLADVDGVAENPVQMTPAERFSTNGIFPARFAEGSVPTQTVEFRPSDPGHNLVQDKGDKFPEYVEPGAHR